ncbi:nitrous oxide reductase accessory protein NosL [Flavihumibacter petaseus]|uniref:Copper chaperone NosL n=1 Tax=Flavihumibacter petaseus NBRC 106054 TaxID=1220578 RepID=A0A0E9MZX8_9BACT|nr:nitrous oxide reductase accessory protein NosL [Flavihumibacter petaseus]GAO42685.1 hypothetical protein FPE01S_01_17000 [Flavihumibacter petaseus NBRC 106054]
MSNISRVLIAVGALVLIAVYFVPVWSIYLIAPQYPEGLSMQIWLNKITGQVDIINGLNHYIGMKHITVEMFPEFTYLVYILGFFILFVLLVSITGKTRLLFAYLVLSVVGGIAALVDFYMWGYDYGHNLDSSAAIRVPGLSYQPPLIGHKKLLNFDAYSYPDTGAWIIVAVTAMLFVIWFLEWRREKKINFMKLQTSKASAVVLLFLVVFLGACTPKPEKIAYGKDSCSECKMTIVDPKFGAEIITKKGKVYKFDDTHCIAAFLEQRRIELGDIHQTLFVLYDQPGEFVSVKSVEFVVSTELKSPMGGNAAAFAGTDAAKKKSGEIEGSKTTNWATLYNILVK